MTELVTLTQNLLAAEQNNKTQSEQCDTLLQIISFLPPLPEVAMKTTMTSMFLQSFCSLTISNLQSQSQAQTPSSLGTKFSRSLLKLISTATKPDMLNYVSRLWGPKSLLKR